MVNTQFCDVIFLLRIAAGIGSVILVALMGVKWMTSEDTQGRDEARKGIIYVIVGGLIVAVASYLVGYLYVGTIMC